jgi:hypothetical protein
MADADSRLEPAPFVPLDGGEPLEGLGATVRDFWSWGFSDLRSNVVRGVFAEFIVARAVGAGQAVRAAWDDYDVEAPDGTRIEVKSSGYLQSWAQLRHSTLSFGKLTGRSYDYESAAFSAEREVRADVFRFLRSDLPRPRALRHDRPGPVGVLRGAGTSSS